MGGSNHSSKQGEASITCALSHKDIMKEKGEKTSAYFLTDYMYLLHRNDH